MGAGPQAKAYLNASSGAQGGRQLLPRPKRTGVSLSICSCSSCPHPKNQMLTLRVTQVTGGHAPYRETSLGPYSSSLGAPHHVLQDSSRPVSLMST